jgi:hypothetical protein
MPKPYFRRDVLESHGERSSEAYTAGPPEFRELGGFDRPGLPAPGVHPVQQYVPRALRQV